MKIAERRPMPIEPSNAWRDLMRLRANHSIEWQQTFERFLKMTMGQLNTFLIKKKDTASLIELMCANAIMSVTQNYSLAEVMKLQEAACGPSPRIMPDPAPLAKDVNPFDAYPLDTVIKMIAEMERRIKERECNLSQTPQQQSELYHRLSPPLLDTES